MSELPKVFITNWGIEELVSEGTQYWDKHKSAPDIAAMKMSSRANEAKSLTDRNGLGGFCIVSLNLQ